jgi:hypothetical protein
MKAIFHDPKLATSMIAQMWPETKVMMTIDLHNHIHSGGHHHHHHHGFLIINDSHSIDKFMTTTKRIVREYMMSNFHGVNTTTSTQRKQTAWLLLIPSQALKIDIGICFAPRKLLASY